MLPSKARKPLLSIYNFARYADELADCSDALPQEKLNELKKLYDAVENSEQEKLPNFLQDIFVHLNNYSFNKKHLLNLLQAFMQDVTKQRYDSFQETLEYCNKSAATIGRIFLECSGEYDANYELADKICIVLQLINHLQDLKKDYENLNRIYFDKIYFPDESELLYSAETEQVKTSKERIINRLYELLQEGREIVKETNSLRVSIELATICNVASALLNKLRVNDILHRRVELTKAEKFECLRKAFWDVDYTKLFKRKVKRRLKLFNNHSSFLLPMLTLGGNKRKMILAFYDLCAAIDDCADKRKNEFMLGYWEREIGSIYNDDASTYPTHKITKQLAPFVKNASVSHEYFSEIIEGQKMDMQNQMMFPKAAELDLYCYREASCVGIISAMIFGYQKKNDYVIKNFATHLGKYFQYINILRDFDEDLKNGRIYAPWELLEKFEINLVEVDLNINNIAEIRKLMKPIFYELANTAKKHFESAFKFLPEDEKDNIRPALLMEKIYSKYLQMMLDKNFEFKKEDIRLGIFQKLKLIIS